MMEEYDSGNFVPSSDGVACSNLVCRPKALSRHSTIRMTNCPIPIGLSRKTPILFIFVLLESGPLKNAYVSSMVSILLAKALDSTPFAYVDVEYATSEDS